MSKGPLISPIMSLVVRKNGMIARRATLVAAATRYWQGQPFAGAAASNPLPHRTLSRTVSGVLLLAKGITLCVVAFLASHPAKSGARS